MWRIILLTFCLAACGVATPQPQSAKTVAAYEVPLPSAEERAEFLMVLGREAKAEGLHVDADSAEELAQAAQAIPLAAMTIHAGIWRGSGDDRFEGSVMDQSDHLGRAWIMFSRGEDPESAQRFRDRAMRAIIERWPDTLSLPITQEGAIPNAEYLRRTPAGYKLDPAAAALFGLPPSSPLVKQP